MASKNIKGLTVEIGGDTTKLGAALADVEKKSGSLSSELGQINRLLKLDPSNTELLAQKQKVLADAIGAAKDKLDTLKNAEKQVQEQFERGEVSEAQVRELKREIVNTTNKIEGYEKAAKEATDAVEDVGEESEKTERKSIDLGEALEKGVTAGLFGLVGAATAAVGALVGCVESTEEYRGAMGKLETAFTTSNFSADTAKDTYKELQSILGETDQAVEASSHLAKLAKSEEDLKTWTTALTGVYASFGDSLPVEGLAEAANESMRTGQVTGALADALNWAAKEGETFGVQLKEQIEFTELSKEEIEALTDAEKEAYEIQERKYKNIEEWNNAILTAASAEDMFNIALGECSDEQERQQLITETLTELYGDAAGAYKETNEEIINSNKATEELNEVWAEVGKKATPIVTTFKEGIADIGEAVVESLDDEDIEDFQNSIKSGFANLSQNVIPKLITALGWVIDNFSKLASVAMGFIAAIAVAKIVSFATAVGSTLVNALKAAKKAQEGMNVASSANPYILLAEVVIGLATAIGGLLNDRMNEVGEAARITAEEMYGLSEAQQEVVTRANEAAEAFRSQKEAFDETVSGAASQFGYLDTLCDELFNLADATGKVEEKDRARVDFILGQLNEALGTEYKLTGDQIEQYDKLADSIDVVMEKKKAEILMEASASLYAEALKNKSQAEEDYYSALGGYMDLQAARDQKMQEYKELQAEYDEAYFAWEKWAIAEKITAKSEELKVVQENLDKEREAYENSKETLGGYYDTIGQYETANLQLLEGNTDEAVNILSDLGYYYDNYAAEVGYASDEVQNQWELDVIDAGLKAERIKTNWENGVEGYTEDMVKESEEAYNELLEAYADAHLDAAGVGEDLSDGLGEGMDSKRSSLIGKAKSLVQSIIGAFKDEADSHSPSRKMMAFGEDMGAGTEIGLENSTKDILGTARRQVNRLVAAYRDEGEEVGPNVLRSVNERALARTDQNLQNYTNLNASKLDKILAAIERGQVLLLDGDKLVGGTAARMDQTLGQHRMLVARGAV